MAVKTSFTNNALHCNHLLRWGLSLFALAFLTFDPFPCSLVKADSVVLNGHTHHDPPRELQETIVRQEENGVIPYSPCSLCQGSTILADKIPLPEYNPNSTTCEGINESFESLPPTGSCRADDLFNLFFEACCRPSIPVYQCEQNVQNYILGASRDYNSAVPPIVGFDHDEKLNITVGLQFQAIETIEVQEGTATIFITMKITWNDPRLKWEIDGSDKCANVVDVWTGHEVEKTSIWIPDLNLLNQIEGVQSMPDTKASVYSDGTVVWSVSGGLKAFCGFTGLASIPFDTLGCQYLFGPYNPRVTNSVNYILETPDLLYYGMFDTSYNEWNVIPKLGEVGYTMGVIYYNVYFQRATVHYIQNIVIPTIILTYLSFLVFLLDMRVGERLGFGMALALVVVAQQIVTAGMIPISNQKLWLTNFVAYSFYFVLIGVVESVLIGFLYFVREDKESKKERAKLEETDEVEIQPLMKEQGEKSPDDKNTKKDSCLKNFLYTVRLRRVDMVALTICVLAYTAFIVVMFISRMNDSWLSNEPYWFDESSNVMDVQNVYVNGDPNN